MVCILNSQTLKLLPKFTLYNGELQRAGVTKEDGGFGCQAIRDSAAISMPRSEGRDGGIVEEGY